MMFSNIPHMQRQKLVILERVRHDVGRFTNPVFNAFLIASAVYLPCYAKLMFFSNTVGLDHLNVLLALSAIVLVLMSPAFALAATLEFYFSRRIAKASLEPATVFKAIVRGSARESTGGSSPNR